MDSTLQSNGHNSPKADCLKAFNNALEEGQSKLSCEDYKVAVLELLGYKPSKYEIEQVKQATGNVALQQQHWLDKEQFTAIMLGRLKERDKDDLVREVFVAMDIHQKGFLTQADCRAAFKAVLPKMKEAVLDSLFEEVDLDGDGRISFKDFGIMMSPLINQ